jgi:nicotinate-nucleotide pyrophosphorylase (carboxylating)
VLLPPQDLTEQVAAALREDVGSGDVTADLVPVTQRVTGKVITREDAIVCGRPWVTETFRQLDPTIRLTWACERWGSDQRESDAV